MSSKSSEAIDPMKVLIVGGGIQYIRMFYEAGFIGATSVEDADIICFTGGEDVDPQLYGERALNTTHFNVDRDKYDGDVFEKAKAYGIPCVGICRGGQFLNVMNGGKMWQHVNNHGGSHSVIDSLTGAVIEGMTSTHHQMMIPSDKGLVLATAKKATYKQNYSTIVELPEARQEDVEAVWYEDNRCLSFQPHPEFTPGSCRDYFLRLMEEYIIPKAVANVR